MIRALMIAGGCVCLVLGCIGIVVPVLPTTPLVLLAAFLFAKSSPRLHAWICSTRVYRTYVAAFLDAGGMPIATKARALGVSYAVLALSAILVRRPLVWAILACVALFLLWLIGFHIKTVRPENVQAARSELEA